VLRRLFWAAVLFSLFAANAVWCWRNRVNGDVAWYLYAAMRLRDGAKLYHDLQSQNLPLTYLVHLPTAYLSALLRVPIQAVFYGGIWLVVAAILIVTERELRRMRSRAFLLVLIAAGALSLSRGDFGQRDPLVALCLVPPVLAAYLRVRGETPGKLLRILLGVAAVAIAIKPYFLVPWSFVVLWLASAIGWRRVARLPETWAVPAVSGLSWIATIALFPSYLGMASLAGRYYGAFDGPFGLFAPLVPASFTMVAALLWKAQPAIRPLIRLSACCGAGFVLECLIQRKGFSYHIAPALFWAFLCAGLVILDISRQKAAIAPVLSAGVAVWSLFTATVAPPLYPKDPVEPVVARYAHQREVLSLSTDLWMAFPLVLEAGARNAPPDLWPVAGMYQDQVQSAAKSAQPALARYHTRAEMSEAERALFDQVVQAMTVDHPAVLLVQRGPWKQALGPLQFDFLDYYSTDSAFRAELQHYVPGPSNEKCQVWIRSL